MESSDLTLARKQWFEGDSLEAGRLLFESIPPGKRAAWACRMLEMAVRAVGTSNPLYDRLIALPQADWIKAKEHFDRIRNQTLVLESNSYSWRPPSNELIVSYIAENVAKVIYNACETDDEFDDDTGWWVVRCLSDLVVHSGIPGLRDAFWVQMVGGAAPSAEAPRGRSAE